MDCPFDYCTPDCPYAYYNMDEAFMEGGIYDWYCTLEDAEEK